MQDTVSARFRIVGTVIDAATRRPLDVSFVQLKWSGPQLPAGSSGPREFLAPGARRTMTNDSGKFEFTKLPNGAYTIVVQRATYAVDSVEVSLYYVDTLAVLVSLQPDARPGTKLSTVTIVDERRAPGFRIPDTRAADSAGVRALSFADTRRGSLAPDALGLTARDITAAITLAEPDPFRALQRTPGVGTRDDYTASFWTRGASWDQTRVYFDGVPLYNPTHAAWLFSSINPEALGEATFMPGVRPASIGEGGAGVLDLKSRTGGLERDFQVTADLSMVSARVAADGKLPSENGGWMVALRRTYVDLLTSAVQAMGGREPRIPYDFSDVVARFDTDLPLGFAVEASGLYERDHLRGDFPGVLVRNRASWGNKSAQVTLIRPFGGLSTRLSFGGTRFGTQLLELEAPSPDDEDPTLPSLENALTHTVGTLELSSSFDALMNLEWALGAQLVTQRAAYDGPFSLTAEGVPGIDRDHVIRIPFHYEGELQTRAAWFQTRLSPLRWFAADIGVRAETGGELANSSDTRIAPRFTGRISIDTATSLSLGWARSYQYAQDVGAAAGPLGPQLHLTHIWQLSSTGIPALRSDIATIGVERAFGNGVFLTANAYQRHATGVTIPDPTPGEIRSDRALFRVATNDASGVELSLRRLVGVWNGSVGYTLASSRMRSQGLEFPAPADVRHSVDAMLARRLGQAWRVSGAVSFASGVPYTRLVIGDASLRLEDPYSRRTPSYASMDLSLDYNWTVGTRSFAAYVQIRNVLNRRNAVTYSGSPELCSGTRNEQGVCSGSLTVNDRFDAGIPVLPLLGVRFVF